MKQLPEYWYVLYNSEDEFHKIARFLDVKWSYYHEFNKYGTSNVKDCEWFDETYDIEDHKNLNIIKITFEEWEKYVVNKEPFIPDLTKLLHILKFINNYGNTTNKA